MIYGKEHKETGLMLERDCYAEHFAQPDEIEFNYMVKMYGDCIVERSDRKELAHHLRKVAMRMLQIANFLDGRK